MSLIKAKGNMYPWVTHMHSHLRGACPHKCPYCYVQAIGRRFCNEAFLGPLRMDWSQLGIEYGKGRTIFVEHTCDLFAEGVKTGWIDHILTHCREWEGNTYVFQTRNTRRLGMQWWRDLPHNVIVGTTIETDGNVVRCPGRAPDPYDRASGLGGIKNVLKGLKTFVTVEPILDCDVQMMLILIETARPDWVNIGADSKGSGLVEPSGEKVIALIEGIKKLGIEIRQKPNLNRILKGGAK